MSDIKIIKADTVIGKDTARHKDYVYNKKEIVSKPEAAQCVVSVYEIPPGKAAYPYHYHLSNEEIFYILKGQGLLVTPKGKRIVGEGDFIYFPANDNGAHKLINSSDTDMLVYIDFDTQNDIDIAMYPDSGKIGVWGKNTNRVYNINDNVDYYEGE